MVKQKILAAFIVAALSSGAYAFSLGGLTDAVKGGAQACMLGGKTVTAEDLTKLQKGYQANTKKVSAQLLGAQKDLAAALGLKEQAANAEAQLKTLKKGNITADKLEKVTTVSADVDKAIQAKAKELDKLSETQKKQVSKSLGQYGSGALGTARVTGEIVLAGAAVSCVAMGDPLNAPKLKKNLGFIADSALALPGFTKDLITTGFSYAKLFKNYGVDVSSLEKSMKQAQNVTAEK